MKTLFLEDLGNMTEQDIIKHIKESYFECYRYNEDLELKEAEASEVLNNFDIIIAYESVGSWGCDSSSFFLLKNKLDNKFYEVHGSHCSCYGFEGQFNPEESGYEYLTSDKFNFWCGGYDENETSNQLLVKEFLKTDLINWIVQ